MGNHTATRARGRGGTPPADPSAPITRTSGGMTITYRNAASLAGARAMFGRVPSVREMGRLVGVFQPAGTTVSISGRPVAHDGQPFLLVDVRGHGFHTNGWIERRPTGPFAGNHIYNQERTYDRAVVGDEARARALREQVRSAARLGVTLIAAKAYTNQDGTTPEYLALPQMGYDAPRARVEHENTPVHERRAIGWPARFARAENLSDLLRLPGGAAWWRENGLNPDLQFNPAPGSADVRRLSDYLRQHGLPAL